MELSDSSQDCLDRALEKQQTERDLLRKCADDPEERQSAAAQSADGCFDCNICLIFAVEPVLTLCGHLYCWPCIYKWLQVESAASRQCPVCKAPLSGDTLIPLYGRGCPDSSEEANPEIPRRSSLPHRAMIASVLANSRSPAMNQQERRYGDRQPTQPLLFHHGHGEFYLPASSVFGPTAGGGLLAGLAAVVLSWTSSTRNHHEGSVDVHASPRQVGRLLQVESCLQQIWLVLFCCVVVCLLFF